MLPEEKYKWPKISICIATYNMKHVIKETLWSCAEQLYPNFEICVYDDCSTDKTNGDFGLFDVSYKRGETNVGVGEAFNRAIEMATGDIVVLMCADDLFTNRYVLFDIAGQFLRFPGCGVVVRWYYQFTDDPKKAVRAWRTTDPCLQANNPSGLAFRKNAIFGLKCSNRMFIETSYLVKAVTMDLWGSSIIKYDTVAVRVHGSTSTQKDYWLKRRVSSPVLDWVVGLGVKGIATDFCSLVQIKNGFTNRALLEEIRNFIIVRPLNLLHPMFWFYAIITLITPRRIMRKIPVWYRRIVGSKTTKIIARPI